MIYKEDLFNIIEYIDNDNLITLYFRVGIGMYQIILLNILLNQCNHYTFVCEYKECMFMSMVFCNNLFLFRILLSNTNNITITNGDSGAFTGFENEIKIWNVERNATEIQQDMAHVNVFFSGTTNFVKFGRVSKNK